MVGFPGAYYACPSSSSSSTFSLDTCSGSFPSVHYVDVADIDSVSSTSSQILGPVIAFRVQYGQHIQRVGLYKHDYHFCSGFIDFVSRTPGHLVFYLISSLKQMVPCSIPPCHHILLWNLPASPPSPPTPPSYKTPG